MASLFPASRTNAHALHFEIKESSNLKQPCFAKFAGKPKNHPIVYESYSKSISSLCKDGQLQEAVDCLIEMESGNVQIGPDICGQLLQGCVHEGELFLGQQLHAKIIKHGEFLSKNELIETKLVILYAKFDLLNASRYLFFRLTKQNVFSWAAIIGLYCRMGFSAEALWGFVEMLENGILGDNFVLPNILKACGALKRACIGKCVHGYALKLGFGGCVFVGSSLVDMYGKCALLDDARKLFDGIVDKNVVVWNSMIVSYVQNGFNEEAIQVFHDMRIESFEVSCVTLSSFLSASANLCAVEEGKQGHAIAILNGMELDNILGSSIINFYAKVARFQDAELVFGRMLEKDVVTWNLLISSYMQHGLVENAISLCHKMRLEDFRFDSVTLSSILSVSSDMRNLKLGREGHCYCIRNSFVGDVVVTSSIINMYAKCDKIQSARQVFDTTKEKDHVLWNTILAAYAGLGLSAETLKLFYQMQLESILPNVVSWNSVILGFLRNGQVKEACDLFSQMLALHVQPNLITFTTLITGLSQNGLGNEAVIMFQRMIGAGLQPNTVSLLGALSACADTASPQYGREIHCYIMRQKLPLSVALATSLVDMYAKCGSLKQAKHIFDMMTTKELSLYNAMISAYALHGCSGNALALYKHLEWEGTKPDSITFTCVLSSCSHAGLVSEGLKIFHDMVSVYHVKPSMEHYGCIITLLSRHGDSHEVLNLIETMPVAPDAHLWGSLLANCRELNEREYWGHLSDYLIRIEPYNAGNYVTISNAYAAAGRWNDVSKWRNLMKEKGLRKSPGCSWIQIGLELHVFVAGDTSNSKTAEIYALLALLETEMCLTCYQNTYT